MGQLIAPIVVAGRKAGTQPAIDTQNKDRPIESKRRPDHPEEGWFISLEDYYERKKKRCKIIIYRIG